MQICSDMYKLSTGSDNEKFVIGYLSNLPVIYQWLPEILHLFWDFPVAWFPPSGDCLQYIVFLPLIGNVQKWRKSSWAVEKAKRRAGCQKWCRCTSFRTNVRSSVTAGEWPVNATNFVSTCKPPPVITLAQGQLCIFWNFTFLGQKWKIKQFP